MNYDEIPEWITTTTYALKDGDLTRLNYLKGTYIGQASLIERQANKIQELEEQVQLARAYERERIIQWLEKGNLQNTAKHLRENLPE